jgi:alkanesulfonate monooxygenase SsuD/methylene tetrahydromethanopterin reductase-like flavin-dependent oxidoreductase (luciferase family)
MDCRRGATIAHAMFTEDRPSFMGRHYRIDEALNSPRPIHPAARGSWSAAAASNGRSRSRPSTPT